MSWSWFWDSRTPSSFATTPSCLFLPHFFFAMNLLSTFPLFFFFFFVVVLLFSCSLAFLFFPSLFVAFSARVKRLRLGVEQRGEDNPGRGYICSFMTNHMCFWVFVFTCFSWRGGQWGGGGGERKDRHMVLVCRVQVRVAVFVSCEGQKGNTNLTLPPSGGTWTSP